MTAIVVAAIGVIFMAYSSNKLGTLFGLIVGLISALGFSIGSVTFRWKRRMASWTFFKT